MRFTLIILAASASICCSQPLGAGTEQQLKPYYLGGVEFDCQLDHEPCEGTQTYCRSEEWRKEDGYETEQACLAAREKPENAVDAGVQDLPFCYSNLLATGNSRDICNDWKKKGSNATEIPQSLRKKLPKCKTAVSLTRACNPHPGGN
ncbi:hypothetical protein CDD83_6370 [Cordyceps sp. RAO-2017]|nr:hypothetical protein CDD83_6370 [Cordyceps sp. RAO-2017]